MRLSRPAWLVLGGLLLAGCGSASHPGASATPRDRLSAVDSVSAAADRTSAAGSSKFTLATTTMVSGQTVSLNGSGAFDYAHRTGMMTFAIPAGVSGRTATLEERLLGDAVYITLPGQPGTFYKLSLSQLGSTSLGSGADPTAGLAVLRGATAVRIVGHELVRGADTTRYSGSYDVAAALAKAPAKIRAVLAATLSSSNLSAVPFEAFLDDQGRMRRLVTRLSAHSPSLPNQVIESITTLEFFDFGTPVTVSAPPASQVKDGSRLVASLGGKVTTHG